MIFFWEYSTPACVEPPIILAILRQVLVHRFRHVEAVVANVVGVLSLLGLVDVDHLRFSPNLLYLELLQALAMFALQLQSLVLSVFGSASLYLGS